MPDLTLQPTDALVIVDVQNTFCPGGTLPVPDGDAVIPPLNRLMPRFAPHVYATQDWHPENHLSFTPHGGPWPPHALQNTPDAALNPALDQSQITYIAQKGTDPARESYSGFDGTTLATHLTDHGINRLFLGGLATDYCVKATALDALAAGFAVVLLTDAVRAVNVHPNDGPQALQELQNAGCLLATSADLF